MNVIRGGAAARSAYGLRRCPTNKTKVSVELSMIACTSSDIINSAGRCAPGAGARGPPPLLMLARGRGALRTIPAWAHQAQRRTEGRIHDGAPRARVAVMCDCFGSSRPSPMAVHTRQAIYEATVRDFIDETDDVRVWNRSAVRRRPPTAPTAPCPMLT